MDCFPLASTWIHPRLIGGVRLAHSFSGFFFVLSYYVSLRFEFCVVMSVAISA